MKLGRSCIAIRSQTVLSLAMMPLQRSQRLCICRPTSADAR